MKRFIIIMCTLLTTLAFFTSGEADVTQFVTKDASVYENFPTDGFGDGAANSGQQIFVGEWDTSTLARFNKGVLLFDLPTIPDEMTLQSATLRLRLTGVSEPSYIPSALLYHSVTCNSSSMVWSLFQDSSFVNTGIVAATSSSVPDTWIYIDVSTQINADYNNDTTPFAAFRIQFPESHVYVKDDIGPCYAIAKKGGTNTYPEADNPPETFDDYKPRLVLEFSSTPVGLIVRTDEANNVITAYHSAVNCVFDYPGVHYGTLPTTNPESRRPEYIQALHDAGIRAIRFPGGTFSHWYLPGNPDLTSDLLTLAYKNAYPHGHRTRWEDVRDTLKQADIKIIYALNTSFFEDEQGVLRPVSDTKYPRDFGLSDGQSHVSEAAAALNRLFDEGIFTPGDVDYWELGNEEFAKMTDEQYADIVTAFTQVLVQRDPGRPICCTNHGLAEINSRGVFQYLTGVTRHYPYSKWSTPSPRIATASYEDFVHVDQGIGRGLDAFQSNLDSIGLPDHLKLSITETNVYKFNYYYDSHRVNLSYAHAHAYSKNWPRLISHPGVDMAVYHGLESSFFGVLPYNVGFSEMERYFSWLDENYTGGWEEGPAFHHQNVLMPTAYVMSMLSRLEGAVTAAVEQYSADSEILLEGRLAGKSSQKSFLFVSNPNHQDVRMILNWPAAWPLPVAGKWHRLESDSVYTVLENEYSRVTENAPLPTDGIVEATLPALSINLFEWTENYPPIFTRAHIMPASPYKKDILHVVVAGWDDVEGDPEGYHYQWKKNGIRIPLATESTLLPEYFTADDSITCVVTAWDGVNEGARIETAPVIILSSQTYVPAYWNLY